MKNNEKVILSITLGYAKYISQFYGLSKIIGNARKNCFRFREKVKLKMKIDSGMSNINICYLKLSMPTMYTQFFKKNCRSAEYVKSVCIERNNTFHFACRKWIINQ